MIMAIIMKCSPRLYSLSQNQFEAVFENESCFLSVGYLILLMLHIAGLLVVENWMSRWMN